MPPTVPAPAEAAPVDAGALRRWAGAALAVLGRHREEIDALNVFPIADSDTGTNMYLTFEAACRALDDRLAAPGPGPSVPEALQALAHGALLGARGNSGVILSQLLRGAATARYTGSAVDGAALAAGLAAAAELAYDAVARPATGTILTVATAAAESASAAAAAIGELAAGRRGAAAAATGGGSRDASARAAAGMHERPAPLTANDSLAYVAQAAAAGAREALGHTTEQLDVLRRAGVVDAGGLGLVVILETLAAYTGGVDPRGAYRQRRLVAGGARVVEAAPSSRPEPEFEVIYLVEASENAVAELRRDLDEFCERGGGDSLVVVGGEGLWRVHVHVDDAGYPIEAGIGAGRLRDITVTHLPSHTAPHAELPATAAGAGATAAAPAPRPTRVVVAVAYGEGIAALLAEAGAHVLRATVERPPSAADFERAVAATRAAEVVLLPNDAETIVVAAAVAERLSAAGSPPIRVASVPAKVTVQGIAALAVHEPNRRFDADVVAMTAAAGATRYGAIEVAVTEAWTMAGVCRPGQVLGHVENDVALIEDDQAAAAVAVLERMLSAGGEMVTLVVGDDARPGMSESVADRLRERHPVVDVVVYEGGQTGYPLLIGVE
ncbi:MAG: DAK2 domain-containing protein [Catenulisporales bacterium]|nr:DAK2 domain-containing protein [Catenulisporales bacterium]